MLILFPLVVMFTLSIIGTPYAFSGGEKTELIIERSTTESQLLFVTGEFENIYQACTSYWFWIERYDKRVSKTNDLLDSTYGASDGHYFQSTDLVDARDEKGASLDNTEVWAIIKYDPDMLSEMKELEQRGMSLSNTVIFVGLFVGMIAVATIIGLHIFGSGLSGASITIIFQLVIFLLLWSILSIFSYSLFLDVPLIGMFLWMVLTFCYTVGVVMRLGVGSGGAD